MIPGFTEDWFPDLSCEVLARLVGDVADVDGMLLEIGSWEGKSTCAFANAAYPRTVHAVDTWEGSGHEISEALAAERDVFAKWCCNIEHYTKGNVRGHRMGWREFVPTITEPVALGFIDAEHSYDEVFDNVAALLPLLASGGILCGDDVHHFPVMQAIIDHFGVQNVDVHASLWIWRKP